MIETITASGSPIDIKFVLTFLGLILLVVVMVGFILFAGPKDKK